MEHLALEWVRPEARDARQCMQRQKKLMQLNTESQRAKQNSLIQQVSPQLALGIEILRGQTGA